MGQYKTANELHEKAKEIVYANKEKDDIIENTVKKEMYKYSKYIDIDRMLLIVAYRIKEAKYGWNRQDEEYASKEGAKVRTSKSRKRAGVTNETSSSQS